MLFCPGSLMELVYFEGRDLPRISWICNWVKWASWRCSAFTIGRCNVLNWRKLLAIPRQMKGEGRMLMCLRLGMSRPECLTSPALRERGVVTYQTVKKEKRASECLLPAGSIGVNAFGMASTNARISSAPDRGYLLTSMQMKI